MKDEVLCLSDVSKIYGKGDEAVRALLNINFSISRGELLVVLGPSGSGKSTLMNIICGLEAPSSGTVEVEGQDLGKMRDNELCKMRRDTIGLVFQFFHLHPSLTVHENIEFPMMLTNLPEPEKKDRIRTLVRLVGLEMRVSHFPSELSGGEKQRTAIARALANDPSIVLADEPTGDLDSEMGMAIISLLESLVKTQQKTVVVGTHDERFLEVATLVLRIDDGRMISDTPMTGFQDQSPDKGNNPLSDY